MAGTGQGRSDAALVTALVRWYDRHERPLPWRRSTPWGVLVSEFMLQQTPVDRVVPVWHEWLDRWPTPPDLARASTADALRAWGRLGYPRRAQRLHQAARVITAEHGGRVPDTEESLRALPGVGEYTAAAVLAFAFGRRSVVLDTNVRRVVARVIAGEALPTPAVTTAERERAQALWPAADARSARWSAAVMEFGALVCTARSPSCDRCPVHRRCAWIENGRPEPSDRPRRQPEYAGSDRQVRGRIMALLRDSRTAVPASAIEAAWPDDIQRERALTGLLADGLVVPAGSDSFALPS